MVNKVEELVGAMRELVGASVGDMVGVDAGIPNKESSSNSKPIPEGLAVGRPVGPSK